MLGFEQIDRTTVADVGGKGAHLGELSRIDGVRVPAGFCVTTDAFRRIMAAAPSIDDQLDLLSRVAPDDQAAIRTLSAEIRGVIEGVAMPDDLAAAISESLARLGEQTRLRGAVQRDGRGPADRLLRRPAGLVPERRGPGGGPAARPAVLGLAVHRAGGHLPAAQRLRPPHRADGRGRAADGVPRGGRGPVHRGPRDRQPEGRHRGGRLRARRGAGLRSGDAGRLHGARRRSSTTAVAAKRLAVHALPGGGTRGNADRAGAAVASRR